MFIQILGGLVLIPLIILTTLFSRRVVRHPIFTSFCVTLVIYSLSFTLLYAPYHYSTHSLNNNVFRTRLFGGQINNPKPPPAFCLIQAGLVGGSPVMIALGVMMFTLNVSFLADFREMVIYVMASSSTFLSEKLSLVNDFHQTDWHYELWG